MSSCAPELLAAHGEPPGPDDLIRYYDGGQPDWRIAFDYKADLSDLKNVKHRGAGGLELLVGDVVALRGGATWDATNDLWWLSAGVGLLTEKGGAQIVLRRRLNGPGFDQLLMARVTLYLE